MSSKVLSVALCLLCGLAAQATAQTVTVAPSGGDFTTVKSAVDSFNTGGPNFGNAAANVIQVTPGTYLEPAPILMTVGGDWTIQGMGGQAILVVASPASTDFGLIGTTADSVTPFDDGINGTVTIENVTLLPANEPGTGVRAAPTKGFIFENASSSVTSIANTLGVTMRNVLVSANNGSNQPASDGTFLATGDYTAIGSNGLRMLSGVDALLLENVTITHCGAGGVSDNGDINTGIATTRTIGGGCVFSYNNGDGWNLSGGDLTAIDGTETSPVLFMNNNGSGLRFNSSVNDFGDISYAVFMNNFVAADAGDASGVHFVGSRQTAGSEFYRCLFAFNGSSAASVGYGNISAQNSQSADVTFRECTIFDAGFDQPTITQFDSTGVFTLNFIDCVIAAQGLTSNDYIRSSENDSVMTFTNCALVTEGPYSLDIDRAQVDPATGTFYGGALPEGIVFNNVIHASPNFISIDPADDTFLDVQSLAYLQASSTSGPLKGSQDFVMPPTRAKAAWLLY